MKNRIQLFAASVLLHINTASAHPGHEHIQEGGVGAAGLIIGSIITVALILNYSKSTPVFKKR